MNIEISQASTLQERRQESLPDGISARGFARQSGDFE